MDLNDAAAALLAFCRQEGMALGDDLSEAEAAILAASRRVGARALELQLAAQRLGYEGAARTCECGGSQRFVGHRPKTIATLMGTIRIRRAYYHCDGCHRSALPYDLRVGLGAGPESVGLAQAAALLGIQDTFANAAATLLALTGQRLSECTIERLTEAVGGVAARDEARIAADMQGWKTPPAEAAPDTLYVAVDGVQVHRQDGWHEAKCVACFWNDARGEQQTRYAVRFENAAEFKAFVWGLACRCGLEQARRVVLLGDGARWIWDHIGGLLKEAVCIVDWYHALQHVWACGRALHGDGTDATRRWVESLQELLWEGRLRELLDRLSRERSRLRASDKRQALRGLIHDLQNQGPRLAYDRFRAAGLAIGSGTVEAACKHVVALRMKRCDMRWSTQGAQHVLSLRTAWLNGDWDRL